MQNIRKEIYEISKNILKEKDYQISDIELSALVLYSILNSGYCKDTYNYMYLQKNIYNEYTIYNDKMNNIFGCTNQEFKENIISFNDDDDYIKKSRDNDILIKEKERNYLIKLVEIIEKNKTDLNNLVKNINLLNNEENYLYFEFFVKIFKNNDLMKILNLVVDLNIKEEDLVNFNNKYKITNKKDSWSYSYEVDNLISDFFNYEERNVFLNFFKENLNKKNLVNLREKLIENSSLEKFDQLNKENLTIKEKVIILFNEKIKNKMLAEQLIKNLEYTIRKETIEEVFLKNKEAIKIIEEQIYKKRPDLLNDINNTKIFIKKIDTKIDGYNNYTDYYKKTENYLDFHYGIFNNDNIYTSLINGISIPGYYNSWTKNNSNEIYFEIRNSLEVLALLEFKYLKDLNNRTTYTNMKNLNVLKLSDIDILNKETFNIDCIKNLIKESLNNLVKENTVLFYDFLDSKKYSESTSEKLYNIFKEIESDYKDIIFVNGNPKNTDDIIMKLRFHLLDYINSKKIDFKKALLINKEFNFENENVINLKKLKSVYAEQTEVCIEGIIKSISKNRYSNKI